MSAHKNTRDRPRAKPRIGPRARIEIYFKTWCPYSRKALALLSNKGVPFDAIDVTSDRVREAEMIDRSGRTSVPQIFFDGKPVGGSDELSAFVDSGAFDERFGLPSDVLRAA